MMPSGAPAKEARSVAGGESDSLVEKEQLRPTLICHYLTASALVVAIAYEPGLGGPAFREQGFGQGIVDDTAIAGEQAALGDGNDFTERRNAILQVHCA